MKEGLFYRVVRAPFGRDIPDLHMREQPVLPDISENITDQTSSCASDILAYHGGALPVMDKVGPSPRSSSGKWYVLVIQRQYL